jgi:hypothetical protein
LQLTEAEASFRALKSERSIRSLPSTGAASEGARDGGLPRIALWVTLKHLLKRRHALVPQPLTSGVDNTQPLLAMRALALLPTLQSANVVLPTTDVREIRLRRISEPTAKQKSLLQQLA